MDVRASKVLFILGTAAADSNNNWTNLYKYFSYRKVSNFHLLRLKAFLFCLVAQVASANYTFHRNGLESLKARDFIAFKAYISLSLINFITLEGGPLTHSISNHKRSISV